jgi:hypothetical protein
MTAIIFVGPPKKRTGGAFAEAPVVTSIQSIVKTTRGLPGALQ